MQPDRSSPCSRNARPQKTLVGRAQWKTTGLVAGRTEEGENRQSDGVIGKAQVQDAAKASFFGSEEAGKAKPNSLGTTGAHNGPVNHDGIIVLGRMKFEHHATSHWNALTRAHATPPKRQIRQRAFDDDALTWVIDGANLCGVLDRDTLIVAARIGLELAEETCKAMSAELTTEGIDGQGTEEPSSHPVARSESGLWRSAFWARAAGHCRSGLLC